MSLVYIWLTVVLVEELLQFLGFLGFYKAPVTFSLVFAVPYEPIILNGLKNPTNPIFHSLLNFVSKLARCQTHFWWLFRDSKPFKMLLIFKYVSKTIFDYVELTIVVYLKLFPLYRTRKKIK